MFKIYCNFSPYALRDILRTLKCANVGNLLHFLTICVTTYFTNFQMKQCCKFIAFFRHIRCDIFHQISHETNLDIYCIFRNMGCDVFHQVQNETMLEIYCVFSPYALRHISPSLNCANVGNLWHLLALSVTKYFNKFKMKQYWKFIAFFRHMRSDIIHQI